jgi:hypothetical protein
MSGRWYRWVERFSYAFLALEAMRSVYYCSDGPLV